MSGGCLRFLWGHLNISGFFDKIYSRKIVVNFSDNSSNSSVPSPSPPPSEIPQNHALTPVKNGQKSWFTFTVKRVLINDYPQLGELFDQDLSLVSEFTLLS